MMETLKADMDTKTVDLPLGRDADCPPCVDRLRAALLSHTGVGDVQVVHDGTVLRVTGDRRPCDEVHLNRVLESARRTSARCYTHPEFSVDGMDLVDRARQVEEAVRRLPGVNGVRASAFTSRLRLEFDPTVGDLAAVYDCVRQLSHRFTDSRHEASSPLLERPPGGPSATLSEWLAGSGRVTRITTALLVVAVLFDLTRFPAIFAILWYGACVVLGGAAIVREGLAATTSTRRLSTNLLMSTVIVGAVGIGAWMEAAVVVVLVSIGAGLERLTIERTRGGSATPDPLTPPMAVVLHRHGTDGGMHHEELIVPADAVAAGDVVIVGPGRQIPADGTIIEGRSAVDQAVLTGDSAPVSRGVGSSVFAGSLNGDGSLALVVTNASRRDGAVERIGRFVADAQGRPSSTEQRLETFARRYMAVAVAVAAAVMTVPSVLGVMSVTDAIYAALAVAVIARPAALVLAAPVPMVSVLGRAAAAGVLVKGPAHVERAATIATVVFNASLARAADEPTERWTEGGVNATATEPTSFSREGTRETLEMLGDLGIERTVMVTEDQAEVAAAIAGELGVTEVASGLGADGRADAVRVLGDDVAMVGAATVDASALAAAGLAVAFGTVGDAGERGVADVVVLGDDPRKVAALVATAQWARTIVLQNVGVVLGAKVLAVVLLVAGLLPLWAAIGIDIAASMLVAANGLRVVAGHPRSRRPCLILNIPPPRDTPVFV